MVIHIHGISQHSAKHFGCNPNWRTNYNQKLHEMYKSEQLQSTQKQINKFNLSQLMAAKQFVFSFGASNVENHRHNIYAFYFQSTYLIIGNVNES